MNARNRISPRGTVLMTSVLLLTRLGTLGMGMLSSSLNENTISRNDINAQTALAVAEAGVNHARKVISAAISTTTLNDRLSGATSGSPWRTLYITPPSTSPLTNYAGLGTGNGTYGVQVSNNLANYKGTTYPAEGTAAADIDKLLWIESVGTYRNASRTVRVLVNFNIITDPPAAITLVDGANPTQLTAGFGSNAFVVDGNDHNPPDMAGACGGTGPAKHGMSVNSNSSKNVIKTAIEAASADEQVLGEGVQTSIVIKGKKEETVVTQGSYENNGTYTRSQLQALATSLLSQATPLTYSGGSDSSSDSYGCAQETKDETGKVICPGPGIFKATKDTKLMGNGKGYGILVVTDELYMQGNYKWEGLILVVGKGSFHVTGSDSIAYGAVLVANTAASGTTNLEVSGNGGVYFSNPALCRVKNMMPSSTVIAWQQRW